MTQSKKPTARRGPPTKDVARKNLKKRIDNKAVDALLKGEELVVDNYYEAIKVLVSAMKGEIKGVTPTNIISSAKVIKEWGDKIMQEDEKNSRGEEEETTQIEPEEETKEEKKIISLVCM
jgi:hypothetical protein